MHPFGIMQGRLLPKYKGRYQAHPVGYWQEEFFIAKELGLECIEFIVDYDEIENNPLMSDTGIREIESLINKTGVLVKSVCADCFMEMPLHSKNDVTGDIAARLLDKLIEQSAMLGITDLVLPCVDQSRLTDKQEKQKLVDILRSKENLLERSKINIALETDLAPSPFGELLALLPLERIKVNYDIGNSASLGYDMETEFSVYGDRVTDLHIKDRQLGGGSVILGSGNADFVKVFSILKRINYQGITIMQAYRDDQGVDVFSQQLDWLKNNFLN